MWYKTLCSPTFEKQLKEIYKYVAIDLKSLVGWQSIRRYICCGKPDEDLPQKYQASSKIRIENNRVIKRITADKYTIFYHINYEKKEIYLLHLLYRKN